MVSPRPVEADQGTCGENTSVQAHFLQDVLDSNSPIVEPCCCKCSCHLHSSGTTERGFGAELPHQAVEALVLVLCGAPEASLKEGLVSQPNVQWLDHFENGLWQDVVVLVSITTSLLPLPAAASHTTIQCQAGSTGALGAHNTKTTGSNRLKFSGKTVRFTRNRLVPLLFQSKRNQFLASGSPDCHLIKYAAAVNRSCLSFEFMT